MPRIDEIKPFYEEAFRTLDRSRHDVPAFSVEFFQYVNINHTIRVRNGVMVVRLSDLCRDMPLNEHRALAYLLIAKILRKRIPADARDLYSAYVKSREIQDAARVTKRIRGRKIVSGPTGRAYDLVGVFEKVNQVYFGNRVQRPVLTWSARKTYRILGHWDSAHETIVISKTLDSVDVPKFVVEYVMFHEMLHIIYPSKSTGSRRITHSREFRAHEREFHYYAEADRWIREFAAGSQL